MIKIEKLTPKLVEKMEKEELLKNLDAIAQEYETSDYSNKMGEKKLRIILNEIVEAISGEEEDDIADADDSADAEEKDEATKDDEDDEDEDEEKEENKPGAKKVVKRRVKKAKKDVIDEDSVDVIEGERYIRSYSEEIHGEDFMELAEEFCSKKVDDDGKALRKIVNGSEIEKVFVSERMRKENDDGDEIAVDVRKEFKGKDCKEKAMLYANKVSNTGIQRGTPQIFIK